MREIFESKILEPCEMLEVTCEHTSLVPTKDNIALFVGHNISVAVEADLTLVLGNHIQYEPQPVKVFKMYKIIKSCTHAWVSGQAIKNGVRKRYSFLQSLAMIKTILDSELWDGCKITCYFNMKQSLPNSRISLISGGKGPLLQIGQVLFQGKLQEGDIVCFDV